MQKEYFFGGNNHETDSKIVEMLDLTVQGQGTDKSANKSIFDLSGRF